MPSDLAMITDPYYPKEVCNALTWCSPETATHIWDVWTNKRDWVYENCRFLGDAPSEMILLRKLFDEDGKVLRVDNTHEGIYSYKAHITHNPDLIEKAKIIYFHGEPKPHELGAYPVDDLITPHWR